MSFIETFKPIRRIFIWFFFFLVKKMNIIPKNGMRFSAVQCSESCFNFFFSVPVSRFANTRWVFISSVSIFRSGVLIRAEPFDWKCTQVILTLSFWLFWTISNFGPAQHLVDYIWIGILCFAVIYQLNYSLCDAFFTVCCSSFSKPYSNEAQKRQKINFISNRLFRLCFFFVRFVVGSLSLA